MNRQKIKDAFDSYVQGFDLNNPKIRLKYEHTYHVAENCEEIAKDVFNNEAAVFAADSRLAGETAEDTAWLIGMLHDIGRFEQLKRYDTFNDRLSIDHAAFGAAFRRRRYAERTFCHGHGGCHQLRYAVRF